MTPPELRNTLSVGRVSTLPPGPPEQPRFYSLGPAGSIPLCRQSGRHSGLSDRRGPEGGGPVLCLYEYLTRLAGGSSFPYAKNLAGGVHWLRETRSTKIGHSSARTRPNTGGSVYGVAVSIPALPGGAVFSRSRRLFSSSLFHQAENLALFLANLRIGLSIWRPPEAGSDTGPAARCFTPPGHL